MTKKQQVIDLIKQGKRPKEIVEEYGIAKGTVSSTLATARKEGLLPKGDFRSNPPHKKEKKVHKTNTTNHPGSHGIR